MLDQTVVQALHIDMNWRIVINDRRGLWRLVLLQDAPHRADQIPQLHLLDRLSCRIHRPWRKVERLPHLVLLPIAAPLFQHARGVFELFVFQQPQHKFVAFIGPLFHLFATGREHHPRFDLNQCASQV